MIVEIRQRNNMSRTKLLEAVTTEIRRRVPNNNKIPAYFTERFTGEEGPKATASTLDEITLHDVATMFKHKRRWDVLFAEYNKGEVSVEDAANKVGLALPHVPKPERKP